MKVNLFNEVGFTGEYRNTMKSFYGPYFDSAEKLDSFFYSVFKTEKDHSNYLPRRMMNQIQRFISLAKDIEIIRPGVDSLRIIFLKICLESLASLSKTDKKSFYKHFVELISDDGKKYILNNIKLIDLKSEDKQYKKDLTIDNFFDIIKSMREMAIHEGICWETQLFSSDDMPLITTLTTNKNIFTDSKFYSKSGCDFEYCFETTLKFEEFIYYFIEACISYLLKFIDDIYSK